MSVPNIVEYSDERSMPCTIGDADGDDDCDDGCGSFSDCVVEGDCAVADGVVEGVVEGDGGK